MITLLGFAAGTLTTLSFIPQVHKVWRTKRGGDLSWGMLLAFFSGVVLWLIYGILFIMANAVTLALLLAIILMKIRMEQIANPAQREEQSGKRPLQLMQPLFQLKRL